MSEYHHLGCGCGCNDRLRGAQMRQDFRPIIKEMLAERDAEIQRLQKIIDSKCRLADEGSKQIIAELADALEEIGGVTQARLTLEYWSAKKELIQRAREATR